ncbi:alpha/beta hydrolase [Streptomyces luteolus]|uniref:Alpha/beta hydrolase n=1 Tax=Streptomyces luteolus TaxID=3043615 RepID=A0ABT6T2Q1_9ACTN|nr:alpha/beta hydrolase [Streptomyces sp. B-S-A12]MDI3422143.1 alpha/beta hydrolase [Streptomyces sp. B-S-A12]
MPSYFSLLFKQDFSDLKAAGNSWEKLSRKMHDAFDTHRTKVTGPLHANWEGDDAKNALRFLEDIETRVQIVQTEAMAITKVIDTTRHRMEQAQKDLRAVVNDAEAQHFRIDDDGNVRLPKQWEEPQPDESDETRHERQTKEALLQDYQVAINRAVDEALRASGEGQKALAELDGEILDHKNKQMAAESARDADKVMDQLGLKGPKVPDDPKAAAEWWKGLDADQQREYATLYPGRIGAADGLPSDVRDDANRLSMEQELNALQRGDAYAVPGNDDRLHNLQTLKAELDKRDGAPESKQLYLLNHDAGGDGKAVIAMGNPDTADNVAVQVPGTSTTMDSTGGQLTRIGKLQDAAENADSSASTSTVYWLGYDAPEAPLMEAANTDVAGPGRAEDGAQPLRDFTHGLRASHEGERANLTVMGHSYGSTTVGAAASGGEGLDADNIAVVGSPGMTVDRAGQLNTDNVYFGQAPDDGIGWAQGLSLGRGPTHPDWGGTRFETDTSGHSGYWDDGSQSLANQGRIIAGQQPEEYVPPGQHNG